MINVAFLWLGIFSLLTVNAQVVTAQAGKSKYGPTGNPRAVPLSEEHAYLQNPAHPARDFWALIPFYSAQITDAACSLASIGMVLNAARAVTPGKKPSGADDKLIVQAELVEKVKKLDWASRVALKEGGLKEATKLRGVNLDELAEVAREAFSAYGFKDVKVTAKRIVAGDKKELAELRADLQANEKNAKDFIIANFLQSSFTDDADVGHIAPVAAYDSTSGKVLILDPDRAWYEPYWVTVETLLKGMATRDSAGGKNRGYLLIKLAHLSVEAE